MNHIERLQAERWMPTRFGESILVRRMQRDVEAIQHEAELFLASQDEEG